MKGMIFCLCSIWTLIIKILPIFDYILQMKIRLWSVLFIYSVKLQLAISSLNNKTLEECQFYTKLVSDK